MPDAVDVSVILTTFNRSKLLNETLAAMTRLNTDDFRWELLVVDNASTDDTSDVLQAYASRLPLRALLETRQGFAAARNHGIEHARAQLLVFTDDDVVPHPNWLVRLWQASQRWPDIGIFGGRIQPQLPERLPSWLRSEAMQSHMKRRFSHYWPGDREAVVKKAPIGPNMALRRATLGDLRFDTGRGPDGSENYVQSAEQELLYRLIDRGEDVVFVPEAYLDHIVRPEQLTLAGLNARAFRRGRKNAITHPERYDSSVWLAGAPIRLWSRVFVSTLRRWLVRPFGNRIRYSIENRAAFRRGFLYQRRLTPRSASPSNPGADRSDSAPQ